MGNYFRDRDDEPSAHARSGMRGDDMEHTETKLDYIIENERLREINSELLKALKWALKYVNPVNVAKRDIDTYLDELDEARAAIKAAKGD